MSTTEFIDAIRAGDAGKVFANLLCVALARLVIVGQDIDFPALEVLVEVRGPLLRTTGIGGSQKSESSEIVCILLALDDQYCVVLGHQQLGKPVGNFRTLWSAANPSQSVPMRLIKPWTNYS